MRGQRHLLDDGYAQKTFRDETNSLDVVNQSNPRLHAPLFGADGIYNRFNLFVLFSPPFHRSCTSLTMAFG